MKKSISVAIPEAKILEVNGIEFPVIADDLDVIREALAFEQAFKTLDAKKNPAAALTAAMRAVDYVDVILGAGAMDKITSGRAVGAMKKIEIMFAICTAVIELYKARADDAYA